MPSKSFGSPKREPQVAIPNANVPSVVYLVTNLANGHRYVGKTYRVQPDDGQRLLCRRWSEHVSLAMKGGGYRLHKALRKYGRDSFAVAALEMFASEEDALAAEMRYIAVLAPEYNLTAGGEGVSGYGHTAETKAMLRALHVGRPLSSEHKSKIAMALAGRPKPEGFGGKVSAFKLGRGWSDETRRKRPITARDAARMLNEKTYMTDKPCGKGHTAPRYTSTRQCCECHRQRHLQAVGGVVLNGKRRWPMSAEQRQRISQTMTGVRKTPEHAHNISLGRKATFRKMEDQHHV